MRHSISRTMLLFAAGLLLSGTASAQEVSQERIVKAVANGDVDVAFVWGPAAGLYVARYGDSLTMAPAPADTAQPDLAFAYDIVIGVRKDQPALRERIDAALERRRADVENVLRTYGVPLIERP